MAGVILFGDTAHSAALRHEVPLDIIDPLLFAEHEGRRFVVTSALERDRVRRACPDVELLDFAALGYRDLVRDGMPLPEAEREVALRALWEIGMDEAVVPSDFPLGLAERLRAAGVVLRIDDDTVALRRRAKSEIELDGIRAAQRAAEAAMAAARELFSRATPIGDGRLAIEGKPLLAEDVRAQMRSVCAEGGAILPPDVIIASVWQGYGHEPGAGPLPAGLPIEVDIWPRHDASGCWTDMTRTFVVGSSAPELAAAIEERTSAVSRAFETAKSAIRPGATGRELFDRACDVFESAGYLTQRTATNDDETEGFQFSLGHGVGLEVHEPPLLGLAGGDPLIAGDVLAIEPGLWDSQLGGVRFEDLVLVTEDGCETLTRFPYDL